MKTKQLSLQSRVKQHSEEGKKSAIKEMWNLTEKNNCFSELDYHKLIDAMKKRALLFLIFIVMKRNGLIKMRGVANNSI